MAKKHPAKESISREKGSSITQKPKFGFTAANIFPLACCLLYLGVHFVPNFDAYDAMGPQWMYVVMADLVVILFILSRKHTYDIAARAVFKNIFSRLYLAFFVLAGLSTFTAINPTEAWVCYVRLIATIIAYFNISILLYGRADLFKWLAQLMALILLLESYLTLQEFLEGIGNLPMSQLILNLKGTTGNKNIFAAGLVVKIPFVIYCLHTSRLWSRILNIPILLLGALTLFIVNARASYISLLLIVIFYIVYCLLEYKKERLVERTLYRVSYVLIPIIAAFLISQTELTSVKNLEEGKGEYGTVTDRLGSIAAISDEGNMVRIRLWAHAIDYTKHHPLIGCGIGNWKIACIPYQRILTNDLIVPVHAHDDYLENFAELGIPGGLLYFSLFVCMLLFTIKVYRSDTDEETKHMAIFSFLAFIGYAVDALFNFPMERPISQVFFALIVGLNVNAFITVCDEQKQPTLPPKTPFIKTLFGLVAILLLLPASYVTYLTHRSLVAQRIIMPDMDNEPLKLKWNYVFSILPPIPNLSASAQPIEAIKGRYLYEAGKYDEALVLLNRAISANPVIGYSEFLKASLFYRQGNLDSAGINASKAFYTRPKAKTYYQTLLAILSKKKDTAGIQKAFEEFDRYRRFPFGWNLYLIAMLNAEEGKVTPKLITMLDSGLHLFPGDTLLLQRKAEMQYFMSRANPAIVKAPAADLEKGQTYYNAGIAAFNKAKAGTPPSNKEDYMVAARNFIKAGEITPGNYIIYENAGISYFNMGEYARSIIYFDRVINLKTATDGKSEYFKGVALYNLGKREEGCNIMRIASSKGYKEADAILKANCK